MSFVVNVGKGFVVTVNILGAEWEIRIGNKEDDPRLEECDGYTDWTTKVIGVYDYNGETGGVQDADGYKKKVMRHEIVHAFLFSCGLGHNSGAVDSWAVNEEMVDWFAFMGPSIYKAWESVGAI